MNLKELSDALQLSPSTVSKALNNCFGVDAATRSLYVRYDDKGGDFTEEIAIYEKAIETEKAKLAAKAQAEAEAMAGLAELLK